LLFSLGSFLAACGSDENAASSQAGVSEQQHLVDNSRYAVDKLRTDSALSGPVNDYLSRARGILVFPNLLRAGLGVGGAGGTGVLLTRKADGSGWSNPVFYVAGEGSLGLQIGAEGGRVAFLVMNDGALNKIVNATSVNLGADMSIAIGPYGGGAQGAVTNNLGADLVAFSDQAGIFGGVAIKGGVITPRDAWNTAYYGPGATPPAIIAGQFRNPGARDLIAALNAPRTQRSSLSQ